jgi:SAM-dependent methyltransferase
MDVAAYASEAIVEADHWWFVGRRRLFSRIIARQGIGPDADVLDVGTSTGTNLRMLRELGFRNVVGVDNSPDAIRFCAEKGLGSVRLGDVCALPFPDQSFDLILATDIIEHVDDDAAALKELRRVLRPAGMLLLSVPTFEMLWGLQDDVSHHRRRYTMPQLVSKLRGCDFVPVEHFYFNYILFLPILLARRAMRVLPMRFDSENQLNPGWLNRVLSPLFRFDVWSAQHMHPPFGVSALVLARIAPSVSLISGAS